MIAIATTRQPLTQEHEIEVPNNLELIGVIGVLDQLRSTTKRAIEDVRNQIHQQIHRFYYFFPKINVESVLLISFSLCS
jgi:hypothetical protein